MTAQKGAEKKEEEKVETSALVPQVLKVKTEKADEDAEPAEEDENAGLSLMEIHKKKMEKGKGFVENDDFYVCFKKTLRQLKNYQRKS